LAKFKVIPAECNFLICSCAQNLEGKDVRIADYFDEIAGTSTGALAACLLVVPDPVTKRPKYTARDAINFYLQNAAKVFPQKRL
jgi:patatin-like phospholipase/acyl hydrolase